MLQAITIVAGLKLRVVCHLAMIAVHSLVILGAVDLPKDAVDLPRGAVGLPRDAVGLPRDAVGLPRGVVGLPRDAVDLPRGVVGLPRGAVGSVMSPYFKMPLTQQQLQETSLIH